MMLAVPASALALTGAVSSSADGAGPVLWLRASVKPRRTHLGRAVTITGTASASQAGQAAILQTAPSRQARWHSVASTRIGPDGRFALRIGLRRSGFVRVIDAQTPASASDTPTPASANDAPTPASANVDSPSWSASPAGTIASAPMAVTVAARFKVAHRSRDVLGGDPVVIAGRLIPARAHRKVRLESHHAAGWRPLASDRTDARGAFALRFAADSGFQRRLRVRFYGDHVNGRAKAPAGWLTVYHQSVASWYNDAAGTACGFHAGLGVANKSLPCGTKVRFRYGGRSVTATVDDRGPFIPGRTWDFNQNVAAALHFGGVGTVWATR
jgi:rare lipoprotein A